MLKILNSLRTQITSQYLPVSLTALLEAQILTGKLLEFPQPIPRIPEQITRLTQTGELQVL